MKRHRKPRPKVSKRPTHDNLNPGDLIVRARTAQLLWRVAHAARAISWAPEMEDCGAAAYDILDDAIDDLDAHVRSGCA
jgi:hypothetical protein